jgi:predicted dinucleotide-binding enzyme
VDHGVVVIDTCNCYLQQSDGRIDPIENGMPESRYVEQQLSHPVIKAFNNIYAQHLMNLGRAADTPASVLPCRSQATMKPRRPSWCDL